MKLALGGDLSRALCAVGLVAMLWGCGDSDPSANDGSTTGGAGGIVGTGAGGGSGASAGAAGGGVGTGGACSGSQPSGTRKQVATGDHHTCALKPDGTLWCWGRSEEGALGIGPKLEATPLPTLVGALGNDVRSVAAGAAHTCAIKSDGTLWCWGGNSEGQLGDGTTADAEAPVQVSALGNCVTDVALGANHSCARTADGALWCWGANESGQLGRVTGGDKPVQVSALGGSVSAFALGGYHSCAIKTDNTLWCWGDNSSGQLGEGTTTYGNPPVHVSDLGAGVKAVVAGAVHTCVTKLDGTLWCWGTGSLGDGNEGICQPVGPVLVQGLSEVASLSARVSHGTFPCDATTCGVKADGTLWCWGDQPVWWGWGGLSPTEVGPIGASATSLSVSLHGCAVGSDGAVWCWGFNMFGQLGNGTTANSDVPVKVIGF